MNIYTWPLHDKNRTVQEIKYAVGNFASDLKRFPDLLNMPFHEYYNYVKNIPYSRDVKSAEIVSRPLYLLTIFPALDCKKKSILIASFMLLKFGPDSFRYVLSSNRPDGAIGHIFTQIFNGEKWINADATYNYNRLGAPKKVTNFQIIRG